MLSLHRTLCLGYIAQRPMCMVLIVASIALGVAMLVATRCLDDSLHQAAKGAINPFATLADLLVSNGQTGVPADLADRLRDWHLAGLRDVQPLVMGRAALVELDDQAIRLIGVNWSPQTVAQDAKACADKNAWGLKITPFSDQEVAIFCAMAGTASSAASTRSSSARTLPRSSRRRRPARTISGCGAGRRTSRTW